MNRLFSSLISNVKSVCDTPLVIVVDNVINEFCVYLMLQKPIKCIFLWLW